MDRLAREYMDSRDVVSKIRLAREFSELTRALVLQPHRVITVETQVPLE